VGSDGAHEFSVEEVDTDQSASDLELYTVPECAPLERRWVE